MTDPVPDCRVPRPDTIAQIRQVTRRSEKILLSMAGKEISMACPRCGGLLVPNNEMVTGIYEEKTWLSFQGFRCVNCGFVDDPVIRTNRMSYILADSVDWQSPARSTV